MTKPKLPLLSPEVRVRTWQQWAESVSVGGVSKQRCELWLNTENTLRVKRDDHLPVCTLCSRLEGPNTPATWDLFISWQLKHQTPTAPAAVGASESGTNLWAHASHPSRGVHPHRTAHVRMSCRESSLLALQPQLRSPVEQTGQWGDGAAALAAGTLRSGWVQAVWQERLWAGDAARRLVWHTEGGPGATWVPWRHEGLQEGHKQDG